MSRNTRSQGRKHLTPVSSMDGPIKYTTKVLCYVHFMNIVIDPDSLQRYLRLLINYAAIRREPNFEGVIEFPETLR